MERRKFTREFKLEAVRLIKDRGVSYVQASEDLGVHTSQLRDWVKKLSDDPEHAFPGNGQMKPECPSSNALRQMAVWIIGVTGSSSFSLCGFLLMLQATFLDCFSFDPFSFQQDCLTASEVDVGRR